MSKSLKKLAQQLLANEGVAPVDTLETLETQAPIEEEAKGAASPAIAQVLDIDGLSLGDIGLSLGDTPDAMAVAADPAVPAEELHDAKVEEKMAETLAIAAPDGWPQVDTSVEPETEQPELTELTVIEPVAEAEQLEVEPSVSGPAPVAAPVLLTPPTVLAKTVKLKLAYVSESPAWIEIIGPTGGKAWLKKSALVDWTVRKQEIEVVMDRMHARRRNLIAA